MAINNDQLQVILWLFEEIGTIGRAHLSRFSAKLAEWTSPSLRP